MRKIGSYTYKRILFILLISFETLLIIFSASVYSLCRSISVKEIERLNRQIVEKISDSIQYMNVIVDKYGTMVLNDNKLNTMLYSNGSSIDSFERIQTLSHLRTLSESYGIIHSAVIYNGIEGKLYSWDENYTNDYFVTDLINGKTVEKAPVWRSLPKDAYYSDINVLTYVMYGPYGTDGFLLINVKTDWIENELKNAGSKSSILMVADNGGNIVAKSTGNIYKENKLPEKLVSEMKNGSGSVKYKDENTKSYAVFYNTVEGSDWTFLSMTVYDEMFSMVKKLRLAALFITAMFGILGGAMVFFVGKSIYNPLKTMALKAEQIFGIKNKGNSEIDFLNSVIESEGATEKISCAIILKEIFINGEYGNYSLEKAFALSDKLKGTEKFFLYYIKTDSMFAVKNAFDSLKCESVVTESGRVLVIIAPESEEGNIDAVLDGLLNEYDRLSVCKSPLICKNDDIGKRCKNLVQNSSYSIIYGNKCPITDDTVKENIENSTNFIYKEKAASDIEKALEKCDVKAAEAAFEKFLGEINKNSVNNYLIALTKLMLTVFGSETENSDRGGYYSKYILVAESRQEIINIFASAFNEIAENKKRKNNSAGDESTDIKAERIVEAMKLIIDNCYDNKLLGVALIADEIKLSAGYIGKIFRKITKMTVSDYINNVRMEEAVKVMSSTDYTIKKVMDMTGYDNESTFYKKFKNYTGMTPKEWRRINCDSKDMGGY